MATKKLSELTSQSTVNQVTANDVLVVVDGSENSTKKITIDTLTSKLGAINASGSLSFKSGSVGVNLITTVGASADAYAYAVSGVKVSVQNQLQEQLNPSSSTADWVITNPNVAADSVVYGNFTGLTVGSITGSIVQTSVPAAGTFKFRLINPFDASTVADNTGFTASFAGI